MTKPATVFEQGAATRSGEVQGNAIGSDISVIMVDYPRRGMGPKLHTHPYAETFVVLEGHALFEVGGERIEAEAGMALVAPAGVPHRFENAGTGRLLQVDVHSSDRFVTEWLES
jgi:mannose-6-phosphate isomerase-like protein (cupin superfamily)